MCPWFHGERSKPSLGPSLILLLLVSFTLAFLFMLVIFFPNTLKIIHYSFCQRRLFLSKIVNPIYTLFSLLPFISKLLPMVLYHQIYFFQNLKFNCALNNLPWCFNKARKLTKYQTELCIFSTGQFYLTSSLSGLWYHHPTAHLSVKRELLSPL